MSFHGGVIGMAIAAFIASRIIRMPFATLADLIVIAAPVGIFLVRITNFINGELWGAATSLPWGVTFESGGGIARHPTQLYEAALEGLVLGVVMFILARHRPPLPRCGYLGVFLTLYGVFRVAIEFVRQPDAQLGYLAGGWLTMGMVLCLPMLLVGVGLLIYAAKTRHPQEGLHVTPHTEETRD
jgi:phosphatidylglycerol:prolipoprotein diacylglycerol transferase